MAKGSGSLNAEKILCSAGGPPVEDPMATRSMLALPPAGARGSATAGSAGSLLFCTRAMFSLKTASTFSCRSCWIFKSSSEMMLVGLAMKSTAPSSRALNTFSSPLVELITITGTGVLAIRMRSMVKPSMRGISRSSVTRSGVRSMTLRIPSSPLVA